jgi:hypothetical protein
MSTPYDTGRSAEVSGLDHVATHSDVAAIVEQMLADLRTHPTEWENHTLDRFLEALTAVLHGLPSLRSNRGEQLPDQPSWKLLAETLVAATGYE